MRIGVECGGTFTDLVVLGDDGALLATDKVFSTPYQPAKAVAEALSKLSPDLVDGASLLHGSTVATNALIERKGARVGLLVTKGFRDIIFLQRQDRQRMYDLKLVKPEPLVMRDNVREIGERMMADGNVAIPLDEDSVRGAARDLVLAGVEAIAVSLLHSYANSAHEERVLELLTEEAPGVTVTLSSQCAREFREYERTTTTTVDAFLRPRIASYLGDLESDAQQLGVADLHVMQSNGGMVPAHTAASLPLTMLRSGPAAGVAGAIAVARNAGYDRIVTMDMGGTSTDVAVVRDGDPDVTSESSADGLPLRVPMVDIVAVGAGGGSLVGIDTGGLLTVGPRSAGAMPGPVCYGRGGTQPTVTDANVVRGLLRPETFLGGRRNLESAAAFESIAPLADQLGRSVERLAEDIYQLASVHMASAIRMTTTERGHEVTEFSLCAYGGAGALHAASVADELGVTRVIIPPYNGLASAYGLLTAGFRREFSRTELVSLSNLAVSDLRHRCDALHDEAKNRLNDEGMDVDDAEFRFSADMRYVGQGFEVLVDLPDVQTLTLEEVTRHFEDVQRRRYGYTNPDKAVQLVTLRLTVALAPPSLILPQVEVDVSLPADTRRIVEDGKYVSAVFRHRRSLPRGAVQTGPAVIEDDTSTTFVPTGWSARVDQYTNLILERA